MEILAESAGPRMELASGVVDVRGNLPGPQIVDLSAEKANSVLGISLEPDQIADLLRPIGFAVDISEPGSLTVTVPTFRPDTTRPIDVIEEIARHYGYSRIPRRVPVPLQVGLLKPRQKQRRSVSSLLQGLGAHQAWTPSLVSVDENRRAGLVGDRWKTIGLANPLSPEGAVLRTSLLPGMLRALAFNVDRRNPRLRIYEIGNVFPYPHPRRVDRAMAHDGSRVGYEREIVAVHLARQGDNAESAVLALRWLFDGMGWGTPELKPYYAMF